MKILKDQDPISICLASYNGAQYLEMQLQSIITQMHEEDELLISDDGSSDETLQVIKRFISRNQSIKISFGPRSGYVNNFLYLISEAKFQNIVFSDQDDIWIDGKLDFFRRNLQKNDLVIHNYNFLIKDTISPKKIDIKYCRPTFLRILIKNKYPGCCMGLKKSKFVTKNYFNLIPSHDWYFILFAILKRYNIYVSEKIYLNWRVHNSNITNSLFHKKRSIWNVIFDRMRILLALIFH